ncbi:MAG: hypothetical protein KDD60_00115 [Bdellovibrionales bacterium]|nr:hypothetical protein [Bdellovibrionales bacterium]
MQHIPSQLHTDFRRTVIADCLQQLTTWGNEVVEKLVGPECSELVTSLLQTFRIAAECSDAHQILPSLCWECQTHQPTCNDTLRAFAEAIAYAYHSNDHADLAEHISIHLRDAS